MIGTTTLHLVSGHPDRPLEARAVCVGSALTERFVNVPRAIGKFAITGLTLSVTNAADVTLAVPAVQTGSLWSATIPASHFAESGYVSLGRSVFLQGKDESGIVRTWCVGRGELAILAADGTISTDGTHIPVHYVGAGTAIPATANAGDLFILSGSPRLYTGTAWAAFTPDFSGVLELDKDAATSDSIVEKINEIITLMKG